MQFDLFFELAQPPTLARSEVQAVSDWLGEIQLADRLGYRCAWLVEHHFMRGYSHAAKPELLLAAAAMCSERLRLGLGVIPVPYHHPVHVAERVATLDLISRGRLDVGLGRGFSPQEYAAFGVDMAESHSRLQETLDVLRLSFERQPVTYRGQHAQLDHADILPHVVQQPHPPLWRAAVSPESYAWSAQEKLGVLAGPFKPWFMTRADIAQFKADWTHPEPPRIGMTLGILCLPDGERAKKLAKPAFEWFYQALYQTTRPVLEKQYPGYERFHELGKFRHLLALGINYGLLQSFGMAIAGNSQECIAALLKYRDVGVTHMLLAVGAGALPTEIVRESLQCIAEDVMPVLQESGFMNPDSGEAQG